MSKSRPDRFEDERGVIQDLLGAVDAVTEIRTRKGAVRGNHVHDRTAQWAYVVSGRLLAARRPDGERQSEAEHGPGAFFYEGPGVAHAWKALEDAVVLVFTSGPRSGSGYESDTRRLAEPLL